MAWFCLKCETSNTDDTSRECEVCGLSREEAAATTKMRLKAAEEGHRIAKEATATAEMRLKAAEIKLKSTKNHLTTAIVIGSIGIVISIFVGYQKYNEIENLYNSKSNDYKGLNSRYQALYTENNSLNSRYETLRTEFERSKAIWSIHVTSLKTGNSDYDNKWLTQPGTALFSSQMRYLRPVITYDSRINGEVTFNIKVIKPDGTLVTGTSSPVGFSYNYKSQINRVSNQILNLGGWGNHEKNLYPAGTYTVEVWYNGVCLISNKVTINP